MATFHWMSGLKRLFRPQTDKDVLDNLETLRMDVVELFEELSATPYLSDEYYFQLYNIHNEHLEPNNPDDAQLLLSRYNWIKFDLLKLKRRIEENKAKTE